MGVVWLGACGRAVRPFSVLDRSRTSRVSFEAMAMMKWPNASQTIFRSVRAMIAAMTSGLVTGQGRRNASNTISGVSARHGELVRRIPPAQHMI